MRRIIVILFLIEVFLSGCRKDEELIKGTIAGKIKAYTQYGKSIPDLAGVEVSLFGNTTYISGTLTDKKGQYAFYNIPYGKYIIQSKYEKFAQSNGGISVVHIGGPCPTYADPSIWEVPTVELFIDSIGYEKNENYLFLHLRPDTIYPRRSFIAFAGSDRNISKDNYVSAGFGYLEIWYPSYPTAVPIYGRMNIWNFDQNIEKLKNDTIFLRIYLIAVGQGSDIMESSPGAVGKPSNVIKFLWSQLVQ